MSLKAVLILTVVMAGPPVTGGTIATQTPRYNAAV